MAPSLTSPDTGNLYVGKGIVSFMKSGNDDFRDLGEVPEVELTLNIETLDYFSSRSGIRSKSHSIILEQGGEIRLRMDEWTPENLSMALMGGEIDEAGTDGPVFDILASDAISGELKFHGTNQAGPNYDIHLHNVRFTPSGSINFIQDNDWGGIEVTGEVLISQDTNKFGTATLTNLPSET